MCLLISGACGFSQHYLGCPVAGQIVSTDKSNLNTLRVRIYDVAQHNNSVTIPVMMDGSFKGPAAAIGQYKVEVLDSRERPIYEDIVSMSPGCTALIIELRDDAAKPVSGAVSIARLSHHVPSAALKELRRAEHLTQKGDTTASLDHLQKALAIDPEFFEAHVKLGVTLLTRNDLQPAAAEFTAATKIDASSAVAWTNLAIARLRLGQSGTAAEAANRALQIDPMLPSANFALAVSCIMDGQFDHSILEHLDKTYSNYPHAHILAAQALAGQGHYAEAREHVQIYLRTGHPPDRAKAEQYLQRLSAASRN